MNYGDPGCPQCRRLTSGDCGRHSAMSGSSYSSMSEPSSFARIAAALERLATIEEIKMGMKPEPRRVKGRGKGKG